MGFTLACTILLNIDIARLPSGGFTETATGSATGERKQEWEKRSTILGLVIRPASLFIGVAIVAAAAWGWTLKHREISCFGLDGAGAVASGVLIPLAFLGGWLVRRDPRSAYLLLSPYTPIPRGKYGLAICVSILAALYLEGMFHEWNGARMLWLWHLCFASILSGSAGFLRGCYSTFREDQLPLQPGSVSVSRSKADLPAVVAQGTVLFLGFLLYYFLLKCVFV